MFLAHPLHFGDHRRHDLRPVIAIAAQVSDADFGPAQRFRDWEMRNVPSLPRMDGEATEIAEAAATVEQGLAGFRCHQFVAWPLSRLTGARLP